MRQASYALAALFVPFVGWYLLAPIAVLFGWTRRAFMRLCSWMLLALAVLAVAGTGEHSLSSRAAWTVGWLAGALMSFGLARSADVHARGPGPVGRFWRRGAATVLGTPPIGDPFQLEMLSERRIGRPVLAAARVRIRTPKGVCTHVLALTSGVLWWIELRPWRLRFGPIIAWRSLDGVVVHAEARRGSRHLLELSQPNSGELLEGTVYGPGADRLIGHLTAEEFAHSCRAPTSEEGRL